MPVPPVRGSAQLAQSNGKGREKNGKGRAHASTSTDVGSAASCPIYAATATTAAPPGKPTKKRKSDGLSRPAPYTAEDGKKRYPCGHPGCNKTFSTSGHAARHSRIHAGSRPYMCTFPNCKARFSRQDNSLQHYKTHIAATKSGKEADLSYASKTQEELVEEEAHIAIGRKALEDGTAIAVVRDIIDSNGQKKGEHVERTVGLPLSTRNPPLTSSNANANAKEAISQQQ
ncbi:hypothetical protein K437DRAFT_229541 [Tilletiaria anomala UBC 951]|uniref:C2H2-type domain-containing protein n=1 Tax=Tilletiaria anomala (strain ATCC 24038 / CBS 436.72 / UBC 951) TaxID=1037660 RepID=A0A066V927_TILAU|nr:uncharacterized protein K437DRAFT_229541 [Tilletiaria anomala UBC 951]KDN36783.1 hypothetical protein K437DRAFT_229541 [Tilletiaria anomala UBC 951]